MSFNTRLDEIMVKRGMLCVGLDSAMEMIPDKFLREEQPQLAFNRYIIDQTHDLVSSYKPNISFYESQGSNGLEQLKQTVAYIKKNYPELVVILDAKRGDIGSTNTGYLELAYDYLKVDAITLNPYMGREALQEFLNLGDKGAILLAKTSNPGSGEVQHR